MSTETEKPAVAAGAGIAQPAGPQVDREFTVEARSQSKIIFRRFLQHKAAVVSVFVFLAIVLGAFVGGALWKYSYTDLTGAYYQAPSGAHPLGTDNISHDELALIFRGAQGSIEVALLVAVLATFVGTVAGSIAGYFGGFIDSVIMRACDLVLTLPSIAVAAVIGYNLSNVRWVSQKIALALLLALLGWPYVARIVRGQFLSLREKEFVDAARAMGASSRRIIVRHLLPNVIGSIIVNVTVSISVAILAESALSFLGFGIQPPDTSLGLLISSSVTAADKHPWVFYSPGVVIILIALSINFIGDGLRDAFDPQQTRVRA
jgi:peptide/nickel transport system permease protein